MKILNLGVELSTIKNRIRFKRALQRINGIDGFSKEIEKLKNDYFLKSVQMAIMKKEMKII